MGPECSLEGLTDSNRMEQQRLTYLLQQYSKDLATTAEQEELRQLLLQEGHNDVLEDALAGLITAHRDADFDVTPYAGLAEKALLVDNVQPARQLNLTWLKYAAAAVLIGLLVTAGIVLLQRRTPVVAEHKMDIIPGGNKALLTLADGSTIELDSAGQGTIARQGGTQVIQQNGALLYDQHGSSDTQTVWNTLSTPRGGQYQLTLPDGSKAWLNAESGITFPTAFRGRERTIRIKGEVYLEIAKDETKSFIVQLSNKEKIAVLGTKFNINSYGDEGITLTSLLEGSIRILHQGRSAILQPGQQATTSQTQEIKIISGINTDQVIAWKNGLFSIQDASLQQVMKMLERWYDIEVKYEGKINQLHFQGEIDRGVKLSSVINWLDAMGIRGQMNGRTLVLSAK